MKTYRSVLYVVALALCCAGCIIRDEVTTLTVRPDGSASLVLFHSNIRSTEEGAKADAELGRHVEDFNARRTDEFVRVERAGGVVEEARWLRQEAPFASHISATLPTAASVERFLAIEGEEGKLRLTTTYSAEGSRRRLASVVLLPGDFKIPDEAARAPDKVRQERANNISETRIVILQGHITAAQGWTIASDRRSALLSPDELIRLARERPDRIELFVEWETEGP
jgi:hypothetical protein